MNTPVIIFHNLNINFADAAASVLIGDNIQIFNTSQRKQNIGIGSISGTNIVENNCGIVIDPDFIDNPVFKQVIR